MLDDRRLSLKLLLWAARISGAVIVAFVLMMLLGSAANPQATRSITTSEIFLLALFPIAPSAGYVAAWRWPLLGGTFSLACFATWLLIMGELDMVPIVSVMAIPAILFVLAGILQHVPVHAS